VFIAWQQYKIKRRETRLDLYEKRMEIFNAAASLIALVVREARLDIPDVYKFDFDTRNAEFLFDEDVQRFLETLRRSALKLYTMQKAAGPRQDFEQETELLNWFSAQFKVAKATFAPYLDLRSHR
jgi:hypothetical protein